MATEPDPRAVATPDGAGAEITPGYARYALGVLLVAYVCNFVDRSVLSILLQSIKTDLQVSDTMLGFLSGFAFAFFYTLCGIPIARWADRGSRSFIIALAILVWSVMTALCGFARNFVELALARIGVGVGEAGGSPPAHSLISDYFPPEQRGTALSIYSLGIPIGGSIGVFAGGWLNEWFDWRTAFIVVGLPGVLVALLVRLTLRDPPRGHSEGGGAAAGSTEPVADVFRFVLRLRSFVHMALGAAFHSLYAYGAGAFIPAFFVRVHGFGTGELGTWLAGLGLVFGGLGTFLGGYLSDWVSKRDARWYMWVPAISTLVYIPFAITFYLWPDGRTALYFMIPTYVLGSMYLGPTFAMSQTLVKPSMRALSSAILLFILNLIGMGTGPQIVGLLSDWLVPVYGVESVRYALLFVVVGFALLSTCHYFIAARSLREDLQAKDRLA
jgi:predicted MFS family arabinose efflux permease